MAAIKDFQGKLLISATDGKKLGEIKDVYLDQTVSHVVALYLGKEGLLNRRTLVIGIGKIQLRGIDAWLVNGSDTVQNKEDIADSAEFIRADELRGRVIQTEGGTRIGTVGDVCVDETLKVSGFALDKIAVEGPIAANKAIARAAINDLGNAERPLIAVLEQAEKLKLS